MILYRSDWLRYPSAIPDYRTNNKSFLKYVATLRSMGIDNCLFCLALHDQTLSGVNPYDPNLTDDQKTRILAELDINPWYYLREVARIPVAGVEGGNMVRANRGIIAQWWCIFNDFDIFMMQPRQTGKSVGMDLHHVYNTMYARRGSKMVVLTKDRKLIVKNVKKLKEIRDLLPKWSWLPTKKDKDVEDLFNYAYHDNIISFICAQNDKNAAINASRGHTIEKFHCDEIPFIKYVEVMIPAISSAMDDAIYQAKQNGINYGRAYTTTAGDLGLPHGLYAYNLYMNSFPFTEEIFDVKDKATCTEMVKRGCGLPIARLSLTFSHRMLGMTDEELWTRIRSVESTEEDINKDYFLKWGKGGADSVLPQDVRDAMDISIIQPKYIELTETGYAVKWYINKDEIPKVMANGKFIMGADTSEQIDRDATAFVMIDVKTLAVICSVSIKNANILTAARWLRDFMFKYINVLLVMEKKSTAQTFIDTLLPEMLSAGMNPFKRIWNYVIDDKYLKPEIYRKLRSNQIVSRFQIEDECRRMFGFNQTGSTRKFLYSKVLSESSSQARNVMKDAELVNQLLMLKVNSDGKMDHQSGMHDDKVIAWLLAQWVLRYGKNLDYYGIDSRQVMVGLSPNGEQVSDEDIDVMELIDIAQERIVELMEVVNSGAHPGLKLRARKELKDIDVFLRENGVEPKVYDAAIKQAEEQRRNHINLRH